MSSAKSLLLALFLLTTVGSVQAKELVFLNWADYMDPDIIFEFKQRTGITVKQSYFDSDTTRDELLLETDAKGFDIALMNAASMKILANRGWLEPLDAQSIPNLKHINPYWRTKPQDNKTFGVPYFWGTIGIVYRKDLVPSNVSSWMDLLQPTPALHGKISMIGDSADLIGSALKALGYSLNSINVQELKEAEALLQAQAPAVKTYRYLSLSDDSALLTGQIVMSMMYNGDALMLNKHNENIAFVLPKEGGNIWTDFLSVLSSSPRKAEAKQFINFLNEPEIAARQAMYVHYATPNLAAQKLLPQDFKDNPIIYPSEESLQNSEAYLRLPARAQKNRAAIFSRIVY